MFPFSSDFSPYLSSCISVFLNCSKPPLPCSVVFMFLLGGGSSCWEGHRVLHGLRGPLEQDGGDTGGRVLRCGEKAFGVRFVCEMSVRALF